MSKKLSELDEITDINQISTESLLYIVSRSGSEYTQNKVKLSTLVSEVRSYMENNPPGSDDSSSDDSSSSDPNTITVTIKYDLDGGTLNGSSSIQDKTITGPVDSVTYVELPSGNFVKSGCTFSKWKSDDTEREYDSGESVKFTFGETKTVTFIAIWTEDTPSTKVPITLSFDTTGGPPLDPMIEYVDPGSSATFTLPTIYDGHYRARWSINGTNHIFGSNVTLSSSATAIAHWYLDHNTFTGTVIEYGDGSYNEFDKGIERSDLVDKGILSINGETNTWIKPPKKVTLRYDVGVSTFRDAESINSLWISSYGTTGVNIDGLAFDNAFLRSPDPHLNSIFDTNIQALAHADTHSFSNNIIGSLNVDAIFGSGCFAGSVIWDDNISIHNNMTELLYNATIKLDSGNRFTINLYVDLENRDIFIGRLSDDTIYLSEFNYMSIVDSNDIEISNPEVVINVGSSITENIFIDKNAFKDSKFSKIIMNIRNSDLRTQVESLEGYSSGFGLSTDGTFPVERLIINYGQ